MSTSVTPDPGPSLESFVGEMLGDFPVQESDESTGAPAATPVPAESPAPAVVPAETPLEAPAVEPQATPAETPAATPELGVPADDPVARLAAAPSLTYTTDGVTKTYEGIKVLGEDGAVIDPASVQDLQQKLGERDHLFQANQQLYARTRQFDALTHTNGPTGQERTYRGVEAFQQLLIDNAKVEAAGQFLLKTMKEAFPGPENEAILRNVFREADLNARDAANLAREKFQSTQGAVQQETGDSTQINQTFTAELAKIKAALPGLTDEDMREGEKYFREIGAAIARKATPQEAQQYGLRAGQWFIDTPKMHGYFQKVAALNGKLVSTAKATTTASAQNALRIAQAARPVATVPARPKAAERPKDTRVADADAAWDMKERLLGSRVAAGT